MVALVTINSGSSQTLVASLSYVFFQFFYAGGFNNNNNNNNNIINVNNNIPVNVGLRQGCVMSPWLLNVYMDGVVREVNVRVLRKGLEQLSANSGRFEINRLLFAYDTALVADSEEKLSRLVSEFGTVCERIKL